MALDKKINITEGQVIFNNKVNQGHSHDGIGSAKIDLSSYSIFDLVPIVNETSATTRGGFQAGNERALKNFIINTVQQRVLNPAGITLKANTIDAQRIIVDGTITSNLLSANIVLVNNVISSSNYAVNQSGWFISSNGDAEFSNVNIRGNIYLSNTGGSSYNSSTTALFANNAGYFSLKDKFTWNPASNVLTLTGQITANSGAIGGWLIDASGLSKEDSPAPTTVRANIYPSQISFINFAGSEDYQSSLTAIRLFLSDDNYLTSYRANGIEITDNASSTISYFKHGGAILRGTMQVIGGNITTDQTVSGATVSSANLIITAGSLAQPIDVNRNYAVTANFIRFINTTSGSAVGAIEFNGTTNVNYKVSSDERLKENIESIQDACNVIKQLNPVEFNFINDGPDLKMHGFLAQDMYKSYPFPVSVGSDDTSEKPWGIDYSKITPLLTAGVKELLIKIEELEARIQTLEGV